jgi:endonuclease III
MNESIRKRGIHHPYKVDRRTLLFQACHAASSSCCMNYSNPDGIAINLAEYLVFFILKWACGNGVYNPLLNFRIQKEKIYDFVVKNDNVPASIFKPCQLVRHHLCILLQLQKLQRSRMRQLSNCKSKYSKSESKPEDQRNLQCDEQTSKKEKIQEPKQTGNYGCTICDLFSLIHPSELCISTTEFTETRTLRVARKSYNTPLITIEFSHHDMEKMKKEDIKTTQHYNPEEKSEASYTLISTSTDSNYSNHSVSSLPSKKKKHKKPTFAKYLNKFGEERVQQHADVCKTYTEWKASLPKERIGTLRPLLEPEIKYYEFAQTYYMTLPTLREHTHKFSNPPMTWKARLSAFIPPENFSFLMDHLIQFASLRCSKSERNNWNKVLPEDILPYGTLNRVLWSIMFLKSTNGVADKVSCGHFLKLIQKQTTLSIDSYLDPHSIAAMIRQTSKWVKNTFVLVHIFRHIKEEWNCKPSHNFHDWINFYEIGPKTASLFFHAAFNELVTLPVDSHVWFAFKKWNWTNAKNEDECSWQAYNWMDPKYFIATNDAIGSIRQTLAEKSKRKGLLHHAKSLPQHVRELVEALDDKKK